MGTARNAEVLIAESLSKRRHRSKQERRQGVEETLPSGGIGRRHRHGVNANQVFHWRKLYREGRLGVEPSATHPVPVRIAEVVSGEQPPARLHGGVILVEVGRARIRIEGSADAENLRLIWSAWADDFAAGIAETDAGPRIGITISEDGSRGRNKIPTTGREPGEFSR